MKKLLFIFVILATFVSCKEKRLKLEVTFFTGQKDTIFINTMRNEPVLDKGDLSTGQSTKVILSGVRSYRILSTENVNNGNE